MGQENENSFFFYHVELKYIFLSTNLKTKCYSYFGYFKVGVVHSHDVFNNLKRSLVGKRKLCIYKTTVLSSRTLACKKN